MQIDRCKIYKYDKYSYVNFSVLSDEDLLMILCWRNHPDIRKCMNNTEPIAQDAHLAFCHTLINRDDMFYWLILKNNEPIGVLNIIDVDYEHETCEAGFYLSPDVMGRGESIYFLSNYKDFLLNELQVKGLIGHNYIDNKPSLIFTMFFGAKITGIEIINDRIRVSSLLTKELFTNGLGTERLTAKYAKFYREWDMEKELHKYEE